MNFTHFMMVFLLLVGMVLLAGGATFHHSSYWSAHAANLPLSEQIKQEAQQPGLVAADAVKANEFVAVANHITVENRSLSLQAVKPIEPTLTTRSGSSENQQNLSVNKFANPSLQAKPAAVQPATIQPAAFKPAVFNPVKPEEVYPVELLEPGQNFAEQPVLAVYSDYLTLDFAPSLVSEQNIKRALGRVLLSPDPYAEEDLLSRAPMNYQQRPALYRQVLNHKNQPIRYPNDAFAFADHLLQAYKYQINNRPDQAVQIKISLHPSNLQEPARRYEHWVLEFANQYKIKPALVFAVMETESNFNPRAVSRSKAKGLMQIKPNSAGRDVYKLIDAKNGAPTDAELFDEAGNIRLGVAYLSLLKYEYLADVNNHEIREMIAISSYNGGLSTVLKLFGDTPEKAVQTINRSSKAKVYQTLRYQHASNETRQYLDKVLRAKNKYQALLGEDNRLLASR